MASRSRVIVERTRTRALLLRRTLVGDADLVVSLFTEERGLLSAAARSARRTSSKLGALEPIHSLLVTLEMRPGAEMGKLVDAQIDRPRLRATSESARLDAAFRALTWVRSVTSPLEPDRRTFAIVEALLDTLDGPDPVRERLALSMAGLGVLDAMGYALELDACVSCGTACPVGSSAMLDPARGGLVCRACGGGRILVRAAVRGALSSLARGGDAGAFALDEDAERMVLEVVEAAIAAHAAPAQRSASRR